MKFRLPAIRLYKYKAMENQEENRPEQKVEKGTATLEVMCQKCALVTEVEDKDARSQGSIPLTSVSYAAAL
jgi:hypothetical protein